MTAMETEEQIIIAGYAIPTRIAVMLFRALSTKPICPLARRTVKTIMAEYSKGADPMAVWSERRLSRLLKDFEAHIRNDERMRIKQELGLQP